MDTITLANLLKNQLLNNGIITLSGIGEIVVVDVPSSVSADGKRILPPRKDVRFSLNPTAISSDCSASAIYKGLLSAVGEEVQSCEEVQSGEEGQSVEDLPIACNTGDSTAVGATESPLLAIPDFGSFSSGATGEILFTPSNGLLEECNLYSFEPIEMELRDNQFVFTGNAAAAPAAPAAHAEPTPATEPAAPTEPAPAAEPALAEPAPAVPAEPVPAEPVPAEPAPAEPATAPASAEPVPAEPAAAPEPELALAPAAQPAEAEPAPSKEKSRGSHYGVWVVVAAVVLILVVVALVLLFLFKEELRPMLERLFYSQHELEVLKHFN